MLSHVAIKNFKSIGDPGVDLELKPLTILVGPNGSGKSSILEALHFFRPSGSWGSSLFKREELFHKQDLKREIVVGISLTDDTGFETSVSETLEKTRVRSGGSWFDPDIGSDFYYQTLPYLQDQQTKRMFFISALRGDVPREMRPTEDMVAWTGPRGENLIHTLNQLNQPENLDQKRKVEGWAGEFGVKDLWSGLRRGSATVLYRDLGTILSGISASYGARQVLPIIANLFYCPRDSVFLIEEPEISLHPESQVKLVEMFAEAIKERKQIIITTHSHYLLLALTEVIQKGLISPEEVAVWEITKEREKGTVAKELPITEEGVIKGWVSSFARVDAQLLKGRGKQTPRARR